MTSMVEAIIDKYGPGDDESFDFIAVPRRRHLESTSSESDIVSLPSVLVLDNSGVSSIGDTTKLKEMCHNVTELDLTKNSISDWGEVLSLMNCIPNLQFLNLCANTLDNDSWPSEHGVGSFSSLQHLILNNTGISWDVTHNLLKLCPLVEEIHLSLNEHDDISLPEPFKTYPTVKKIHMSKNNIKNWSELHKVGKLFPNLEHFVNIESQLENLRSHNEEENDITKLFANMKSLVLTQTNIQGWEDFEVLKHCPALVELKVLGIPFLEGFAEKKRRQQLISRLPNIQCLNGTPISDCEREDAERAFIRLYMDSDEKPSRYFELETVHGKLDHLAEVNMSVNTNLDLQLDIPFQGRKERVQINTLQKVQDLLKTVSNIVGLPASKLRVYHQVICHGQIFDTTLMSKYPKKNLWTYNMSLEDVIVCQHRDGPGAVNAIVSFAGEKTEKLERD